MAFETLLGNARLKENLISALARGKTAHFYLISGPAGSGKHTLARLLAQSLLCTGTVKPCGVCRDCRKVLSGSHPDIITVTDPEHKTVPVRMVKQAREDAFVKPNEGSKKIYIFPQELRTEGQNALLKVLEEPPPYGVFFLLAENPESILATVRSRCVQLKLQAVPAGELRPWLKGKCPDAREDAIDAAIARSAGFAGQALALLQEGGRTSPELERFAGAYATRNAMELTTTLVGMEKWKRDRLIPELESWKGLLQQALVHRSGVAVTSPLSRAVAAERSPQELMHAIRCLDKTIEYAQGNVSCAAVCGYLVHALR